MDEFRAIISRLTDLGDQRTAWLNTFYAALSRLLKAGVCFSEAEQQAIAEAGPDDAEDDLCLLLDAIFAGLKDLPRSLYDDLIQAAKERKSLQKLIGGGYIARAVARLEKTKDVELLRRALIAAGLFECHFSIDFRDDLMMLGHIYRKAYAAGIHPDPIFEEVGSWIGSHIKGFTSTAHFIRDVKPALSRSSS
ncbi:MAG: hypothetical protein JXO72_09655 [Vicinamibacteria bacterium]|nr:hypothetical protein [Vicinamibacteria bacterium]